MALVAAWLRAIEMVRALQLAAVVAGHKDPGRTDDPRILDETAEYLHTAPGDRRTAHSSRVLRRDDPTRLGIVSS